MLDLPESALCHQIDQLKGSPGSDHNTHIPAHPHNVEQMSKTRTLAKGCSMPSVIPPEGDQLSRMQHFVRLCHPLKRNGLLELDRAMNRHVRDKRAAVEDRLHYDYQASMALAIDSRPKQSKKSHHEPAFHLGDQVSERENALYRRATNLIDRSSRNRISITVDVGGRCQTQ